MDPVLVPPLPRIDLDAVHLHAEMHVNAAGQAGLARDSDSLTLVDPVAHLDADLAQVAIDRLHPVSVIQHNAIAENAQIPRPHHAPVIGGEHWPVRDIGKIEAQVHLPIDFLAVVNIVAQVGEVGLFLAPVQERAYPENLLLGLEAQIGKLLVVGAAHRAVDEKEARQQVLARR